MAHEHPRALRPVPARPATLVLTHAALALLAAQRRVELAVHCSGRASNGDATQHYEGASLELPG